MMIIMMTIDNITGMSAEQWQEMTDEQLMIFCKPYLHVTRPDFSKLKEQKEESKQRPSVGDKRAEKRRVVEDLMKQMGMKL